MAHHLGFRKCLSQTPNEETFRSSTIISFLSCTLALPPPPGSSAHGSAAHEESTFGRADDLALTPMRLGRGFCLTGRGEERKGNGW